MTYKIFVGTLSSGEGELEQCTAAVLGQANVAVTHCVISGMTERAAHDALWTEWHGARNDHALFVKIDADTVLVDPFVLQKIAYTFSLNPRLTGMQLPIYDHFTDGLIAGLNAFTPIVEFRQSSELFCDRTDHNHDIVLKCPGDVAKASQLSLSQHAHELGLLFPSLLGAPPVPAARHCCSASDMQAFHFGLHRALKGQHSIIERVQKAWNAARDRSRRFALMGANAAPAFLGRPADYSDPKFLSAFAEAAEVFQCAV